MKTLYNILIESLVKGNVNAKSTSNPLNQKFANFEDLAKGLNIFFKNKLKKPIKVIKCKDSFGIAWAHMNNCSKDGLYIKDHFDIQFEKGKIRVGERKEGVVFQYLHKDYRGKTAYEDMTYPKMYKYGTNFLTWIIELGEKEKSWDNLRRKFNVT